MFGGLWCLAFHEVPMHLSKFIVIVSVWFDFFETWSEYIDMVLTHCMAVLLPKPSRVIRSPRREVLRPISITQNQDSLYKVTAPLIILRMFSEWTLVYIVLKDHNGGRWCHFNFEQKVKGYWRNFWAGYYCLLDESTVLKPRHGTIYKRGKMKNIEVLGIVGEDEDSLTSGRGVLSWLWGTNREKQIIRPSVRFQGG